MQARLGGLKLSRRESSHIHQQESILVQTRSKTTKGAVLRDLSSTALSTTLCLDTKIKHSKKIIKKNISIIFYSTPIVKILSLNVRYQSSST